MRPVAADDVDEQIGQLGAAPVCVMAVESGIMPATSTTVVHEMAR